MLSRLDLFAVYRVIDVICSEMNGTYCHVGRYLRGILLSTFKVEGSPILYIFMAKSPTTWEAAQLRSFISRMATQFPRIPLTDIKQIFNACSHHYRHFQTCCMKATLDSVAMNTPRNQYPTFEHLILFLYLRYIFFYLLSSRSRIPTNAFRARI